MYNFKPSSLDCAQFDFGLLFDLLIDLFLFSSFSYLNNLSESIVGYCVCPELLVQCKWRFLLSISIEHLFRVLYCVLRRLIRIQDSAWPNIFLNLLHQQPADCRILIEKLKACNDEQLLVELQHIKTWNIGKVRRLGWRRSYSFSLL